MADTDIRHESEERGWCVEEMKIPEEGDRLENFPAWNPRHDESLNQKRVGDSSGGRERLDGSVREKMISFGKGGSFVGHF